MRSLRSVTVALCVVLSSIATAAETALKIDNSQPFDIYMPIRLQGMKLGGGATAQATSERGAVQQLGDDVVFLADVTASKSKVTKIVDGAPPAPVNDLQLSAINDGVSFHFKGKNL